MVRTLDIFLAFLVTLLIGIMLPLPSHAAGPLTRDEFLEALPDSGVRDFVRMNFKISDTGMSPTLGSYGKGAPLEIVAHVSGGHERVVLHFEDELKVIPCADSIYFAPHCLN